MRTSGSMATWWRAERISPEPTVLTNLILRRLLRVDGPNALAVETIAQTEKDLGINWVDWNPAPPDKDMGLWRGVYVEGSGVGSDSPSDGGHAFCGCVAKRS